MLTVAILINGNTLMARSAVNTGRVVDRTGKTIYEVDDGTVIFHSESDGAVKLAMALLKTIKEQSR